jgi:exodeoxyribonuclease-1
VFATIAVAKLMKTKQPQLFQHLFELRKKDKVRSIVETGKPFMYTTGRYAGEYLHTSAAIILGRPTDQGNVLVYNLRHDPTDFLPMSVEELIGAWKFTKDPEILRLPVKTLKYNRCPAVIPGVVKDEATLERLQLDREQVLEHLRILSKHAKEFVPKLFAAVAKMDEARMKEQVTLVDDELTVDARLYERFIDKQDVPAMQAVRVAEPDQLTEFSFRDPRLQNLLPLYKARNYPTTLTTEERQHWDSFCQKKLLAGDEKSRLARYFERLQELAAGKLTSQQQYILEELQLYGESIMSADAQ